MGHWRLALMPLRESMLTCGRSGRTNCSYKRDCSLSLCFVEQVSYSWKYRSICPYPTLTQDNYYRRLDQWKHNIKLFVTMVLQGIECRNNDLCEYRLISYKTNQVIVEPPTFGAADMSNECTTPLHTIYRTRTTWTQQASWSNRQLFGPTNKDMAWGQAHISSEIAFKTI